MKNERNPEIAQSTSTVPLKLVNFAKALAKNEEGVYEYILLMVKGDIKTQNNYSDYIFTHLRNVLNNEMNTNVLKYASRFITTLALIGNVHIYERIILFLLPVFKSKILEDYKIRMKPVWPIQDFCKEIIYILAMWLPADFYDQSKQSPFYLTAQQLRIRCDDFKFMNVDKLIISHRIIKSLKLDVLQDDCQCKNCHLRKNGKHKFYVNNEGDKTKKHLRQKLYIIQPKTIGKDNIWQTGFEIEMDEEASELQNMMEYKLKSYQSEQMPHQSIIFYRLKQKMGLLEDNLKDLKINIDQSGQKQKNNQNNQHQFMTPVKHNKIYNFQTQSTAEKTYHKKKGNLQSPGNISQGRSLKNFEFIHLDQQYNYTQYAVFEKVLRLSDKDKQKFKNSLLSFNQKIYIKNQSNFKVYCIALAKNSKVKVRVIYQGDQTKAQQTEIQLVNKLIAYNFNSDKYEFTITFNNYFQPLQMMVHNDAQARKVVLPIGLMKLLEPLPESAKQVEKLNFILRKTVKLQNQYIPTYEYMIQKIISLDSMLQKTRSVKITRLFEAPRLKKKLQRRYRLFQTQLFLKIQNNNTQYIDIDIQCQDSSLHKTNAAELLKQLLFICSK